MIPVGDVVPSRTRPVVTLALLAALGLVFLAELRLSHREFVTLVLTYGVVPAWFEWRPLLVSMFLHGSWLHLTVNLLFLWIFGATVEDRLGHGRFALFFLLCGVASGLGRAEVSPSSAVPSIGASGAVAGVMGAYVILFPRSRILTLVPSPSIVDLVEIPIGYYLALWLVLQIVMAGAAIGLAGGRVALAGQLAGFAAGAGLALVLRRRERLQVEWIE